MVPFTDPVALSILAFLERIGIAVTVAPITGDTFLPGLTVRGGALVVDPARLRWPTDLLHEAGHIAVTEPARRPFLSTVSDDPGEEMAAIAWSYAAAAEIGLEPRLLFHDGYKGGGAALAENFAAGRDVGVPMLVWMGMTDGWPRPGTGPTAAAYPRMRRWLR